MEENLASHLTKQGHEQIHNRLQALRPNTPERTMFTNFSRLTYRPSCQQHVSNFQSLNEMKVLTGSKLTNFEYLFRIIKAYFPVQRKSNPVQYW